MESVVFNESSVIFLASSTFGKPLAAEIKKRIVKKNPAITCNCWWDVIPPSENTLPAILGQCKTSDFFIAILTADDLIIKNNEKDSIPRDNCIFEIGLFMGALGAEPYRCFLLTHDIKKEALPSDIRDLNQLSLDGPNPSKVSAWLTTNFNNVNRSETLGAALDSSTNNLFDDKVNTILEKIKELKPYYKLTQDKRLPTISKKDLLNLEKSKSEHGILQPPSKVLVMSRNPIEAKDKEFADQVMKNMMGQIQYDYFFQADKDQIETYANLVHHLLTYLVDGEGVSEKLRNMGDFSVQVNANLDNIKRQLRIYFLPYSPGIQFCIHNANDPDNAECYLFFPEQTGTFVAWCDHEKAVEIRQYVIEQYLNKNKREDEPVFVSTPLYRIESNKNKKFINPLQIKILEGVPLVFHAQIKDAFFGRH